MIQGQVNLKSILFMPLPPTHLPPTLTLSTHPISLFLWLLLLQFAGSKAAICCTGNQFLSVMDVHSSSMRELMWSVLEDQMTWKHGVMGFSVYVHFFFILPYQWFLQGAISITADTSNSTVIQRWSRKHHCFQTGQFWGLSCSWHQHVLLRFHPLHWEIKGDK